MLPSALLFPFRFIILHHLSHSHSRLAIEDEVLHAQGNAGKRQWERGTNIMLMVFGKTTIIRVL
jgi:hypothetical protein